MPKKIGRGQCSKEKSRDAAWMMRRRIVRALLMVYGIRTKQRSKGGISGNDAHAQESRGWMRLTGRPKQQRSVASAELNSLSRSCRDGVDSAATKRGGIVKVQRREENKRKQDEKVGNTTKTSSADEERNQEEKVSLDVLDSSRRCGSLLRKSFGSD